MNRLYLICALVALVLPFAAWAGPNAGGTLIVHNTGLVYGIPGDTTNWCGHAGTPMNCQAVNAAVIDSSNTY